MHSGTSLPAYINSNDPVVQRVLPADVLSKARTAAEAKRYELSSCARCMCAHCMTKQSEATMSMDADQARVSAAMPKCTALSPTEEPVGPIETDSEDEFGLGVLMGGGDESSSEEGDEEGEEEGGSEEGDSEDGDGMEEDEEASDSEGMSEGDSEGMSSEGEEGSDAGPSDDSELEEGRRGDGGGESTRDKEEQEGCGGSSEWEDGAGSSEDGGLLQEGVVGEVSGRRGGLHHLRDSSSGGESERERDSEGDEGEEGEGDSKEGDSEESEGEEDGSTSSGEEEEDGGGGSSGGEEEVQTDIYGRTKGDPAPGEWLGSLQGCSFTQSPLYSNPACTNLASVPTASKARVINDVCFQHVLAPSEYNGVGRHAMSRREVTQSLPWAMQQHAPLCRKRWSESFYNATSVAFHREPPLLHEYALPLWHCRWGGSRARAVCAARSKGCAAERRGGVISAGAEGHRSPQQADQLRRSGQGLPAYEASALCHCSVHGNLKVSQGWSALSSIPDFAFGHAVIDPSCPALGARSCPSLQLRLCPLSTLAHVCTQCSVHRLAEANMSGVAKDVAALYEEHGRRAVGSVVVSQLTQAGGRPQLKVCASSVCVRALLEVFPSIVASPVHVHFLFGSSAYLGSMAAVKARNW
eukprot:1158534-Pelagomonas_calceolata.AAC.9